MISKELDIFGNSSRSYLELSSNLDSDQFLSLVQHLQHINNSNKAISPQAKTFFDVDDQNVPKALQLDIDLWVAVAGGVLNLGLEPIGDPCSLDLSAVGDAYEYPAATRVGKGYQLLVEIGQRLLELDLLSLALFENKLKLLLVHSYQRLLLQILRHHCSESFAVVITIKPVILKALWLRGE